MKFESHWLKGSGGVSFKSKLFSFFHRSETVLAILVEGHLSNIPMKLK